MCIVNSPEDVSDVGALFMLIGDLDKFPNDGNVLSASQITDTQEFILKKEMSTILDRAINNRYFSVYYQPIYNTQEQRFASAEALIRLKDPKYGFISPGVFIPIAEKSGAIHNIGSFVIEEVCKFIASPEFEELGVDYIEINLSVMQCLRSDLADEIISAAEKYQIDPGKLNLEITETASSYSQEKLLNNIKVLNRAGFKFSLDDIDENSVKSFIKRAMRENIYSEEPSNIHYAVVDGADEYYGTVSLKNINWNDKTAEYAISTRNIAKHRGYGQFATREIIKIAFETLHLEQVFLYVISDNMAAIKMYKKCGFHEDPAKESIQTIRGKNVKRAWYEINRDEYFTNKR